ncbi:MAG: D-alanine--D-alanine ligase family protein [Sphaerochaetaceae bacterium]
MKIALTYDLKEQYLKEGYSAAEVAEFDSVQTIEALETALEELGFEPVRIGSIFDLVESLAAGQRWPLVFNIAEGLHGLCREAQVPALLDAYRIPYVFSDALTLTITLHKALAKEVVRKCGVVTADWCVVAKEEDLKAVDLPYPLFIKPLGGGTGMGIDDSSRIENATQLQEKVRSLLQQYKQPVLVETYLGGREFTVGIIGNGQSAQSIGVMEIHVAQSGIYSYQNKQDYVQKVRYSTPEPPIVLACSQVALAAWQALGCQDAGRVDVKMDEKGNVHFLEVNPLAGLHPIDSDLPILCRQNGISYTSLIALIMESALRRLGLQNET